MVLKGSVNFGPRGSTALGFGGHAHRAFPDEYAEQFIDRYKAVAKKAYIDGVLAVLETWVGE